LPPWLRIATSGPSSIRAPITDTAMTRPRQQSATVTSISQSSSRKCDAAVRDGGGDGRRSANSVISAP
jgi:hypothetical protein